MELMKGVTLIEVIPSISTGMNVFIILIFLALPIYIFVDTMFMHGRIGGWAKLFLVLIFMALSSLFIIPMICVNADTIGFVTIKYKVRLSSEADMNAILEHYYVTFTDKEDECILTEKE